MRSYCFTVLFWNFFVESHSYFACSFIDFIAPKIDDKCNMIISFSMTDLSNLNLVPIKEWEKRNKTKL